MKFKSTQIRGIGRGHEIGCPTINLIIPENLVLDDGIYATWITINNNRYMGALHLGSIPTFNQSNKTMEVHLIDIQDHNVPQTENIPIQIEIIDFVRKVWKFNTTEELLNQIKNDIEKVRKILS